MLNLIVTLKKEVGIMTRQEALQRISELSCNYGHIRMTDCPHCQKDVESLVNVLTEETREDMKL